jgi:hypothetical protein
MEVATWLNKVVSVLPKAEKIPTRTRPRMLAIMPYSRAVTARRSFPREERTLRVGLPDNVKINLLTMVLPTSDGISSGRFTIPSDIFTSI